MIDIAVFPYDTVGTCSVVQPLKVKNATHIGLGGRIFKAATRYELKVVVTADNIVDWSFFYEDTINYGTEPFIIMLRTLQGFRAAAVRLLKLNPTHTLNDGVWEIPLMVEEINATLSIAYNGVGINGSTLFGNQFTTILVPINGGVLAPDSAQIGTATIEHTTASYKGELVYA